MQKEKEKRNPGYITWLNRLAVAATIAAIAEAVNIMKNGFGLLEQLDFGAGAYYYADIPGFASLVNGSHYQSPVSMPILIFLFLIWGFLMYRLRAWMESGTNSVG